MCVYERERGVRGERKGKRETENKISIVFFFFNQTSTRGLAWSYKGHDDCLALLSLSAHVPRCRETPLHQLYSSAFSKQKLQGAPTKKPVLPFGDLPTGYQHLHTQLQYECISPFYRRLGSSRRTCLRTGKWSGRAPSCIPSESRLILGCSSLQLTWLPTKRP